MKECNRANSFSSELFLKKERGINLLDNGLVHLLIDVLFPFRIFNSPFAFNTTNWYREQNIPILAIDDEVILESPYGAVVSMEAFSLRPVYNDRTNLTLLITDSDSGTYHSI